MIGQWPNTPTFSHHIGYGKSYIKDMRDKGRTTPLYPIPSHGYHVLLFHLLLHHHHHPQHHHDFSKTTSNSTTIQIPPPHPTLQTTLTATLTATAAATAILTATPPSLADSTTATSYQVYYGTAASAANYGGYGGNSNKKDFAEYVCDVLDGWKERLVSKVEKGTNGTDSEFYNPKKKSEKEYLTFLSGFRQLAPMDLVLNNLALSDVNLQDLLAIADNVTLEEKKDEKGQVYYVYEIDGVAAHSLILVTCAQNKLYAHFVNAPTPEWNCDHDLLKHVHESFKTFGSF